MTPNDTGKMDNDTGNVVEAEAGTTKNKNKPAETDASEISLEIIEAKSKKYEPSPHNDSMDSIGMPHLKITGASDSTKQSTGTEHDMDDTADENNELKMREQKIYLGKMCKNIKRDKNVPRCQRTQAETSKEKVHNRSTTQNPKGQQ